MFLSTGNFVQRIGLYEILTKSKFGRTKCAVYAVLGEVWELYS